MGLVPTRCKHSFCVIDLPPLCVIVTDKNGIQVWIWGITPRMGAALELLAKAYETVGKANRRSSVAGSNRL